MKPKLDSFALIERVIPSAGAMLIFSVYFHLTKCPEGPLTYIAEPECFKTCQPCAECPTPPDALKVTELYVLVLSI